MKIEIGGYDDESRWTGALPSQLKMTGPQKLNAERDHANHLAELNKLGREATSRGDDIAAADFSLRHDFAELAHEAGHANDHASRAGELGHEMDMQEAIDDRNELLDRMGDVRGQHEKLRESARDQGRELSHIDEPPEEMRNRRTERDETQEARQRPEGFGRRRGWDSDAQQARDQGEGAQQQGEPFAARLARMKAKREQQGETARDGQRDGHAERGATPTCDAQGEAYQPRPAGFDRRCDAVDRAAETQKEQAETTKQDERTKPPRVS